jgi:hypothetical protein
MINTRIELTHNRITRIEDASDLAELLFPGNWNQQHCFLVVWYTLKWDGHRLVPNLGRSAQSQGISRRTLERVRAKLRRLGLLDHVSRFSARHGYREGWILSSRFEHGLRQLADRVAACRATAGRAPEKDEFLLHLAQARCSTLRTARGRTPAAQSQPTPRGEQP